MSDPTPRPALEASFEALRVRAETLRSELVRRGEYLAESWTNEAARDLQSGALKGFWLPPESGAPGLAVFSLRNQHAFAHVHVDPGNDAERNAFALLNSVLRALPPSCQRADVGLSGLRDPEELALTGRATHEFGGEVLLRHSLELHLDRRAPTGSLAPPSGGRWGPIRSISLEQLAELDWEAFRGSPDERLVADSVAEERRTLAELMDGRLGPILEDCSGVFSLPDGRPVGLVLVAEQAPRRSIVLDLAVHPAARRRGIGTFLLRSVMERLRISGGELVRLWVTDSNTPARALYERFGFTLAHSARIYRWNSPRP